MAQPGEHYRIRDEVRSVDLASVDDAVHRWRQLGREVAEIRDDLDRARNALMDPSGGWSGDGAERFSESVDAARTTAARVAATAIEGIVDDTGSAFEHSDPDRNMAHQLSQLREDVEFLREDRICPSPLPDKPWHDYPTWTWGEFHKYVGPVEWGHKYRVKRNGEVIREYSPEEAQQAAWAIGAPSPDGLSGEQIDRLLEYLGFNDSEYQTTAQTHGDVADRFTEAATSLPAMPRRTPWNEFAGVEYPSGGGSPGGGGSWGGGGGATPSAPGSEPSGSPPGPIPDSYPGDGNGTGDPDQYGTGDDSTGGDDASPDGTGDGSLDGGTVGTGDGSPVGGTGVGNDGAGGTDSPQGSDLGGPGTSEQPGATDGDLWDEDDWAGAGVAAAGGVGGPGSSLAGIGGGSGGMPTTAGATNPGGLAAGAGGTGAGGATAGSAGSAAGTGGVGAAGRGLTGGVAGSPGMAGTGGAAGRGGIAPMMPMGGGGAGGGDDDERATWLEEDRDVWGLDDDTTPPPVIE